MLKHNFYPTAAFDGRKQIVPSAREATIRPIEQSTWQEMHLIVWLTMIDLLARIMCVRVHPLREVGQLEIWLALQNGPDRNMDCRRHFSPVTYGCDCLIRAQSQYFL
ncbi:hypothetical protein ABFS83_07G086200 [Erythranthe nasuta]